ncbi:MAG: hypothetical protein D6720_04395 [Gammaproteobacteria bacterium]|nr:MAG: hypothetical protein D6720_04395 [Gammaproteobacteria bacterium]
MSKGVLAGVVMALVVLQGCSRDQEDPRIGFCRGLASDLTGSDVATWRHLDDRIVEPEFAEVRVGDGDRTVSCFYAYEAVEPGALEHATPLLAYATLPYEVRVDGRVLEGAALSAAVRQQQRRWNRALLDQARANLDRARKGVEEAVESTRARLQQLE